ncbi:MAG: PdxA family dehydrogenase [Planctomycetaceae bacterium]
MPRPLIALTLGDVAGIGPEVVVRACADERVRRVCRPVVVGHPQVVERAVRLSGVDVNVAPVSGPEACEALPTDEQSLPCWNPAGDEAAAVEPGRLDPRAGRAAYDCLIAATRAALQGQVAAVATAPLNKAALHLAGLHYPGHTEILAEACGTAEFAMMLYLPPGEIERAYGPRPVGSAGAQPRGFDLSSLISHLSSPPHGLGVAHVTLHTSIRSVPDLLTTTAVREKIGLVHDFMRKAGCASPRIGVCALNPHAGEGGLFGDEEQRLIAPAVAAARDDGLNATGPLPADTLLRRAVLGEFDGVVAMYHDQGHIALKLLGTHRAVNVTLGLPIIRTSVAHGTAFEVAWQGRADCRSLAEAARVASVLARKGSGLGFPPSADLRQSSGNG